MAKQASEDPTIILFLITASIKSTGMNPFSSISIKAETAKRFREFSKETGGSNTEVLELMLEYFHKYQISPKHKQKIDLPALDEKIQKRLNAVVAIIKEIEKTQTQPILAMLQLLFDPVQGKSTLPVRPPIIQHEKPAVLTEDCKDKSSHGGRDYAELKKDLEYILGKVIQDKRTFGPDKYVLDMEREELERMKRKLNSY